MKKNLRSLFLSGILVISLVAGLTGCEAIQRKFTRKKKAEQVRPMFYKELEGETTRPPVELYIMHYVYWQTWMDDLINNAGVNKKRDKRACNEAVGNLLDIEKYLTGEKKEELNAYINDLKEITKKIQAGDINEVRMKRLRFELDKLKRRIARKFHYKKVSEHIVKNR